MSEIAENSEKKEIENCNCFPDVDFSLKEITHNVIIRNDISVGSDTKQFSLHCTKISDYELLMLIKSYVNDYLLKKLESKVFFDTVNEKNSHSIILKCKDTKNFTSKLFSINLPNYSSEEIKVELQKYLWGQK